MTDHDRAGVLAQAGGFVGRERELGELRQLTATARAITLCGPAGTGKTRLLRQLTDGVAADFADGAFVVSLSDLHQPDLVAPRVAAALGVSEEPGVPPADTLAEALRGRRLLLALDHCDRLPGACAALSARLLAAAPGLLLVITCRDPQGWAAETLWPVPPLAVPPRDAGHPGPAAGYDAVRLFTERAAAVAPGFALDESSSPAVVRICRTLGGLPLAIELAAARAGELPADELASRLGDWCRLLGDPALPVPERILRATLEWSHDRLSPAEQVLLRRLSVLAGWSPESAGQVCADDELPVAWVPGLLTRLASLSLITAPPGQGRYRMPAAVREYAAGQLGRAGETTAMRRRLRDYALGVSEHVQSAGLALVPAPWAARMQVFRSYEADADNLRTALAWCLFHGDIEAGLRLCTALSPGWIVLGALSESAGWFGAFLTARAGRAAVLRTRAGPGRRGRPRRQRR